MLQRAPWATDSASKPESKPLQPEPAAVLKRSRARVAEFAEACRAYVAFCANPANLSQWAGARIETARANGGGRLTEMDRANMIDAAGAVFKKLGPEMRDASLKVRDVDWCTLYLWARAHNLDTEVPPLLRELGAPIEAAFLALLNRWGFVYTAHMAPLEPVGWPAGTYEFRMQPTHLFYDTVINVERPVYIAAANAEVWMALRLASENLVPNDVARVRAADA